MAIYNTPTYANKAGVITDGIARGMYVLHDSVSLPSTFTTTDTVNIGYLPPNAFVHTVTVKAQTQLDSATSLTINCGYGAAGTFSATPQAFMAASAVIGRAAGASFDTGVVAAGKLLKNTSGAKLPITVTCQAAAGTPVAGVLEVAVTFWIENTVGSQA